MTSPTDVETVEHGAVQRLVRSYEAVAARMQGMPVCNPALVVEGVDFRELDGRRLGVIVTPWFMNLTVLPADADRATWRSGAAVRIAVPSGLCDFVVSEAGDVGLIATRSLFSLMHEFVDQDSARVAARAAVEALFEPPPASPDPAPPAMSRRRFLRGG